MEDPFRGWRDECRKIALRRVIRVPRRWRPFERLKKKAVYGAISLGTIIGVIAVLIVKGCS